MTTYTGVDGSITINAVAVAELRSWSTDYTINTVEDTVMTDTTRSYRPSIREWSGSADIYYDPTVVGNLVDALTAQDTAGSVAFEGYPSASTTGAPKLSGNIIVTGISVNTTMEGMVEASISFQGTGDLTFATVV